MKLSWIASTLGAGLTIVLASACQGIADIPDVRFDEFCASYCELVETNLMRRRWLRRRPPRHTTALKPTHQSSNAARSKRAPHPSARPRLRSLLSNSPRRRKSPLTTNCDYPVPCAKP